MDTTPKAPSGKESPPECAPDPSGSGASSGDPGLLEVLDHMEMPPGGLEAWFSQSLEWCERHGGTRHYDRVMSIYREALTLVRAKRC